MAMVVGLAYVTSFMVKDYFPMPENPVQEEGAFCDETCKLKILHSLITLGVLAAGMMTIMNNGKLFVDEPTRDI